MYESKRDKAVYNAHKLRRDIVHCFPAGGIPLMSVLYGDTALLPGKETSYRLESPIRTGSSPPTIDVWFVSKKQFPDFINCDQDAPPVPQNFEDDYKRIRFSLATRVKRIELEEDQPGRHPDDWARYLSMQSANGLPEKVEVHSQTLTFKTYKAEGVYIIKVDTGDQPCEPYAKAPSKPYVDYVFIYCKPLTTFSDNDREVGKQIADVVNLCRKNGNIWFVHPIYFAEQQMNMKLSRRVKEDMAHCEGLPDHLPAFDCDLLKLIYGCKLAGMERICLHVDVDVEECVETGAMEVQVDNPVELNELLRRSEL